MPLKKLPFSIGTTDPQVRVSGHRDQSPTKLVVCWIGHVGWVMLDGSCFGVQPEKKNQNNIIFIFFHLFDNKYWQHKLPKFCNCSCSRFLVRPLWTGACTNIKWSEGSPFLLSWTNTFLSTWKTITRSVFIVEHSNKNNLKALSHAYLYSNGGPFLKIYLVRTQATKEYFFLLIFQKINKK